jgi:hypothetical protein
MSVQPRSAQPRNVTPPARARQNRLILLAVIVVLLVLVFRACAGHENRYESIARQFTQAVQNDDVPAVQKLENSETAADTPRGRVGSAADALAPLGKIRAVKEVTPSGDQPRVHEFDVRFEKGIVHERFRFDPNDKVVLFHFDAPQTGS